jgi:hypothetical protein
MSDTSDAFVFVDGDGGYYVVPKEVLEQAKVPDEARELVEAQIQDAGDTTGFASISGYAMIGSVSLHAPKFTAIANYKMPWPCDTTFSAPWPCDVPTSARFQGSVGQQG